MGSGRRIRARDQNEENRVRVTVKEKYKKNYG